MIALTEIMLIALPLVSEIPILLGRLNRLLAYNLIDTALSVVLLAVGCLWGVEGAAASRLVYGAAWLCLYFGFMHTLIRFDVGALLGIYARSAAVTLAAVAPLALAYRLWAPPETIGLGALAAATLLGGFTWLAALALTRHPAGGEILALARSLALVRRPAMPQPAE